MGSALKSLGGTMLVIWEDGLCISCSVENAKNTF